MIKKISVKEKRKTTAEFLSFVTSRDDWNLLKDFCAKPQKMYLADVELLLRMYKKMRQQKCVPESACWVENFFRSHLIIPRGISNASGVRGWNNALLWFLALSGDDTATDNRLSDKFIYDWWKAAGNVFNIVKSTTIETAESWRGVFPVKLLVQDECFDILLHCGEIMALVKAGQSELVISYLNKFDMTVIDDPRIRVIIYSWAACVPNEELFCFLQRNEKQNSELENFRIFASHPQGLDCLMRKGCFKLIAAMENSFRAVVENYPYEFEEIQSREHYVAKLRCALSKKI
ncbi:MAG: hypothetical protein MR350_00390 [Alphaproteobacteria bacterium]|nr:hypothetical protein [Alphaproteobacteria bacterium]